MAQFSWPNEINRLSTASAKIIAEQAASESS
jgi:hypothetical protein